MVKARVNIKCRPDETKEKLLLLIKQKKEAGNGVW